MFFTDKLNFYKVLAFIAMLLLPAGAMAWDDREYGTNVSNEKNEQNTPSGWTAVQLPNITSHGEFNITQYGASTSSSDNSTAMNDAISAANAAGGGIVIIPSGTWLSGPITMKSNVVLHLKANATLMMLPFGKYPDGGTHDETFSYKDLIFISNGSAEVNDIIIEGEGNTSVIDGQGAPWWVKVEEAKAKGGSFDRPACIRMKKGTRHLFRNFKIQNTPGTNITVGNKTKAGNVTIHDVYIKNPDSELQSGASHNTDGIPIWEPNVNIYDCNIDTGDDNIVVDSEGHHIHAWNITCGAGHGMSIGSYTVNVHDVIYEGITFNGTGSGFRIKTNNDRSGNDQTGSNGAVKNIICRNATMKGCPSPIKITSWYDKDSETPSSVAASTTSATTPEFCNILFQNITETTGVSGATSWKHNRPIYLYGRPEMYVHDITFDNVNITSDLGMFMAFSKNITFKNGCKIINKKNSTSLLTTEYNAYSDNGSTLISANPQKYNGSETATIYSVKFMDGSSVYKTYNICPNSYAYPPTAPTKSGSVFKGWATTANGAPVVLAQTELAAGGTFYAVWEEEKTETIFSLQVNSGQTLSLAYQKSAQLTAEATITGGTATVYNGKNSETAQNMVSGGNVNLGGSSGSYLKISLSNNTFNAGDVITITNAGNYKITSTNSNSGASIVTFPYTITSSDAIKGKSDLYIWKTGTSGDPSTIKTITVTRKKNNGDDIPGGDSSGSVVTGSETTPIARASNTDQVGLCYTIPSTYVGGQGNSSKAVKFNLRNNKIEINVNPNYTITGFTFTGNDNYNTDGITINSVTIDGGSQNVLGANVTFATDKSENSFTVSNINATQKITITAASPCDNQLNGTVVFTYKYNVQPLALQSTAKTSSRNGSVTLKFNNPMAASNGTATLNGKTLTADADGTSLKFVYAGLDFGQTYTFTVPAGVLKDEFNQTYNEAISVTLITDVRPTVSKQAFDKIVSNGEELAAAIAEANSRQDNTSRYRIFVKKGAHTLPTNGTTTGGDGKEYPDPRTHLTGANVSIIGEDFETTSFTNITPAAPWDNGTACPLEGIGSGDVLIIDKTATETYFQGVTIRTSMGDAHGRDIAVNDQSNKTIMKDVRLWGYQDTYVSNNSNGRFYFDGGVLRGRTDYLCGKGDVFYNKVTLQQVGTGGYIAVPSVPLKYGYVFNECYIKKETSDVNYYLGRPWGQGTPIAMFINTKVDAAPLSDGWAEMSGGWPDRFAEYNTKTTTGDVVTVSNRKTTFASSHTNNPVLTSAEASYYSNMARILGGTDGWDPTLHTEQCGKPSAQLNGETLTWSDDSYASSWIVFKDGEYYANPTTNTLALTESGSYTVRAANNMGGLGEVSEAVAYEKVVLTVPDKTVWDFAEYTEQVVAAGNNYSTQYNGLTIVGNTNETYTSDYITANDGFRCNGNSSSDIRHIVFTPSANGVLFVTYKSNNATANDRITAVGTSVVTGTDVSKLLANNKVLAAGLTSGSTLQTISAELTAGTTYYIYFANGGQSITKLEYIEPMVLSEDKDYSEFPEFEEGVVTLKRTFDQNKWTTLVVPFDVNEAQLKETFGEDVEVANIDRMQGGSLYYKGATTISANEPVLIKVAQPHGDNTYAFNLVTVKNSSNPVTESTDDTQLVGVYKTMSHSALPQQLYFLYDGKFYDASYLGTLRSFRAYILPGAGFTASSKGITMIPVSDTATGINAQEQRSEDCAIYNVAGQRVAKPAKGLYIINGKKYIAR